MYPSNLLKHTGSICFGEIAKIVHSLEPRVQVVELESGQTVSHAPFCSIANPYWI